MAEFVWFVVFLLMLTLTVLVAVFTLTLLGLCGQWLGRTRRKARSTSKTNRQASKAPRTIPSRSGKPSRSVTSIGKRDQIVPQ